MNWQTETAFKIAELYDPQIREKFKGFEVANLREYFETQEKLLFGQDHDSKPGFLWSFYELSTGYNILRASIPIESLETHFVEVEVSEIESWRNNFFRIKFYVFDPKLLTTTNFLKIEIENLGKLGSKDHYRFDIDATYNFDKISGDKPEIFRILWNINSITGNIIEKKLRDFLDFESRASNKWYIVFYLLNSKLDLGV